MTATHRIQQINRTQSNYVTLDKVARASSTQPLTNQEGIHIEIEKPTIHKIWKFLQNIQQRVLDTEHRIKDVEKSMTCQSQITVNKKKKRRIYL